MFNRFLLAALLVVAGCLALARAQEEADREKEIGLLLGHERLFADYCLNERVEIIRDIKRQVNERSSAVFEIFFGAATEIADEVLSVQKQAVEEFSKEIKMPSEQVSSGPLPEDKIQSLIEEGKREIQAQGNALGRLVAAAKAAVGSVFFNAANSAIFVRLAKARSMMDADSLLRGIVHACAQVNRYQTKLESDLEVAKEELKGEHQEEELKKFIGNMSVNNLKCYTTKYISRLNAFCRLFKDGASPFVKMLGLNPDFELPSEDEPIFKSPATKSSR